MMESCLLSLKSSNQLMGQLVRLESQPLRPKHLELVTQPQNQEDRRMEEGSLPTVEERRRMSSQPPEARHLRPEHLELVSQPQDQEDSKVEEGEDSPLVTEEDMEDSLPTEEERRRLNSQPLKTKHLRP